MGALIPEDNNFGALFIGVVLSAIIYGVTWQQGYAYYTIHGNKDRLFIKILVSLLMVVDSVNLAFAAHGSYITSITNFGDYAADAYFPWSIPSIAITGMVLEILIQHFYAYRVYRLSEGSIYMPAVIVVLSLTAFAFGQYFSITVAMARSETETHIKLPFFIASVAMQVACDIIITTSMVFYLFKIRTSIPRTNSVLNTLALYIISCGTLTAISSIVCLVTVCIFQHDWIYIPFYILQVRLYSCSFMSVLNSRTHIRQKFMGSDTGVITISQLQADTNSQELTNLPHRHGTLSTVGRTTPPPTIREQRHVSLSLLETSIPFDIEKAAREFRT
ncbi:hypothetical protein EI94DRAFT_1747033 [Lactarius quietus]|nr:hypothetical protein EI94DRAFT_1747033 [Lactarius quietus]